MTVFCQEDAAGGTSYADGGVANVDGEVGVRGLDVELQDVVDVGRLDVQRAQALHHPRLTAQQLKHTVGDKQHKCRSYEPGHD